MSGLSDYPESEKLMKVSHLSQPIAEFLDNRAAEGIVLCRTADDGHYYPIGSIDQVLATYFGIDMVKVEAERRQMLAEQRAMNERTQA